MANLAGKTFEVQVSDDGRWITVDIHDGRTPAIKQAENLADTGRYVAVRVNSESDRKGTEVVFEKTIKNVDQRPIILNSVATAPVCKKLVDYYQLNSRKTLGRVLRNLLDRNALTALELLFDRAELLMLERNQVLYQQLMLQLSSAQAKVLNVKPLERADVLFAVGIQIKDKTLEFVKEDAGIKMLKKNGIDRLFELSRTRPDSDSAYLFTRHAMARLLNEGGDWDAKIKLIVGLADNDLTSEARVCIDEILSEILDGAQAVSELLGGQSDLVTANLAILQLCEGRYPPPVNPISSVIEFNDLMGRHPMPSVCMTLYERVANMLAGTKKLTKEGNNADRRAFIALVRQLVGVSGLKGGAEMCGNVAQRARITLSLEQDNLSFGEGVLQVVGLLPTRACRIGYLLELFRSDIGKRNGSLILTALSHSVKQLKTLTSLVANGSSDAEVNDAIEGLKRKFKPKDIPEQWRASLTEVFNALMEKPRMIEKTPTPATSKQQAANGKKPKRKTIQKDEILFEEGDEGSEAYLILSGQIEIYRMIGNKEELIAKIGRGEIFGEMSLIDSQPRFASARVVEDGEVTVISQSSLTARLDSLSESDRVLRRLIDVLVNRMRGDARSYL